LAAKLDDTNANALDKELRISKQLQLAAEFAAKEDYRAARGEVQSILKIDPNHAEAKTVLARLKSKKREVTERQEAAQAEWPSKWPFRYFERWTSSMPNNNLFEERSVVIKGTLKDVEARVVNLLTTGQKVLENSTLEHPETSIFRLRTNQRTRPGGWRRCALIGAQTGDGEVRIVLGCLNTCSRVALASCLKEKIKREHSYLFIGHAFLSKKHASWNVAWMG
jgi:hypothetical protein